MKKRLTVRIVKGQEKLKNKKQKGFKTWIDTMVPYKDMIWGIFSREIYLKEAPYALMKIQENIHTDDLESYLHLRLEDVVYLIDKKAYIANASVLKGAKYIKEKDDYIDYLNMIYEERKNFLIGHHFELMIEQEGKKSRIQ